MAKTYIDELVEYPAKAIQKICNDDICLGLLVNKKSDTVTDDDSDRALEKYIFDYSFVDETIETPSAFVWVEAEIPRISNRTVKNMALYVTVVCHKRYMKLNSVKFRGYIGNRRDNLVRFIDKLLNDQDIFGIGRLTLDSVNSIHISNENFTARTIKYTVPDFNIRSTLNDI